MLGNNYYAASYLILSFSIVVSIFLFRMILMKLIDCKGIKERAFCDLISFLAIVFVVARGPLTQWRYYARQCAANPVHNPTLLFVRPIGLLTILAFLWFLEVYERKENSLTALVTFGFLSLLSVFAKPNFAFVFLMAMAVVVLERMISQKSIKIGVLALAAALPSALAMLWQFTYASGSTEAMHVRISFGSFSEFTPVEVVMVSLATFPVPILLFSRKIFLRESAYRMAYYALLIGWLQMFFLTNGISGDFSWGYDLAVQFATVVTLACAQKSEMAAWRKWIAMGIFAYQAFCGICYVILVGSQYEILI